MNVPSVSKAAYVHQRQVATVRREYSSGNDVTRELSIVYERCRRALDHAGYGLGQMFLAKLEAVRVCAERRAG